MSNGGLTRLQRGRCCIATSAPLRCNSGPVAKPGGPYGKSVPYPFQAKGGPHDYKYLYINALQNHRFSYPKRSPIFPFAGFENLGAWRKNFRKYPPLKNGIKFGIFRTNVINRKHDDTNFGVINLLQEKAHDLIHALISHIDKKKCCICFIG